MTAADVAEVPEVPEMPVVSAAANRTRWRAMAVVMAATIMVSLDSTIVNVALHTIGTDLKTGDGIEWVVTAYLLTVCASQPAAGWLSDRFGQRRVFLASLAFFTFASMLCGIAPNFGSLVAFRALQGLGGGAIIPTSMAIGLGMFSPAERGRTMSLYAMSAMMAPALGPTVGGWLIDTIGWHALFLINVPIGILTVGAGIKLLPHVGHRDHRSFDFLGLALGGSGFALFIVSLMQGNSWGWSSIATLACLALGVLLLGTFTWHELRRPGPMIDLRMFAERDFRRSVALLILNTTPNIARIIFIPLQLQALRGFTAFRVGVLFILPAIGSALGMFVGGRYVDRIGPRKPIVTGTAGMFVAMLFLWRIDLQTPVPLIVLLMFVQSAMWGLTVTPIMLAGLARMPQRLMAQASTARSLSQQVSMAFGVAVSGALVSIMMGRADTLAEKEQAFNSAFLLGAVTALFAVMVAFRMPKVTTHHDVDGVEAAEARLAALE